MTRLLAVLILLFILSSCDPGYVVVLSNQSLKDKDIRVIVADKRKIILLDSIAIIDSENAPKRFMLAPLKDATTNSYFFTLHKGKCAILQQGIGGPDLSEKIIIDHSDTILLSNYKRIIKKKQGLSTSITVKLD
jgi:hypothetical protein